MLRSVLSLAFCCSALAVIISTDHGDNARTSANTTETTLSAASFSRGFQRLGGYSVDGAVWSQPLYVPSFTIGPNTYNLLVTCTMHNSCYAFNADLPGSSPLWHAGPFAASRTSYPDNGGHITYGQEIGCLATPVVDVVNSLLYTVCGNSTPTWVLYALNLATGAQVASVTITGNVLGAGDPGGGDCVSGGTLSFCPQFALIRSGLTLANSTVYIAASSYGDFRPFHGWIFGYAASSLSPAGVFCASPSSYGASIWQSAGGLAVDGSGDLYFATGNGTYDGTANFAESILKLSPALGLLDWFTPSNWASLSTNDLDMGSGRAFLPPGSTQVVVGMKDYHVYSVNTGCMGHLGGTQAGCAAPQILLTSSVVPNQDNGIFGGAVFANGTGYFPTNGGPIYRFTFANNAWNPTPTVGNVNYPFPGAQSTYSSNGSTNAILWALTGASSAESAPTAGTLRALDPITLTELWNSDQHPADTLGTLAKFAAPTIANGRVYVPTLDNRMQVYGLPSTGGTGRISINPTGVSPASRR